MLPHHVAVYVLSNTMGAVSTIMLPPAISHCHAREQLDQATCSCILLSQCTTTPIENYMLTSTGHLYCLLVGADFRHLLVF